MRPIFAVVVLVGLVGCAEEKATLEEIREQIPCAADPTRMCSVGCEQGERLRKSCEIWDNSTPDIVTYAQATGGVCYATLTYTYGGSDGCCLAGQWYRCAWK